MTTDKVSLAVTRIETGNHDPIDVIEPTTDFLKWCQQHKIEHRGSPENIWNVLKSAKFWKEFLIMAFKLAVTLISRNAR